ncbi:MULTISPECIES: response regulator [Corallococcus]|uniref:Response regulator n=3 Tax=Corallococcus TaxID=83461 RepID=A0A7Y4NE88_9BACT|nr:MULTISPECIES: response regulator [Corallococcus]RKH39835.1 DNA-binding response regulator [Corallococcus sp. AB050B]RKI44115.1 DNA-binding response regulator [Corallococcus sp. AB049A]MBN8233493.1 response regulator [Corallococcus macrosporus]NOK10689.1 response regulator [Corallococcus exercitus]RKH58288.1 DNA-binding response regulator [Corallococcus interemptor]
MMRVLVVSPHPASRALLSRFLDAEPDVEVSATGEPDDAFASIKENKPALVVVDLRRPDEDHPLFLGLLRKRHPSLPVISLVPGRLRIFDGRSERVREAHGDTAEALHHLMGSVLQATRDLLAQHLLRMLRPPVGRA